MRSALITIIFLCLSSTVLCDPVPDQISKVVVVDQTKENQTQTSSSNSISPSVVNETSSQQATDLPLLKEEEAFELKTKVDKAPDPIIATAKIQLQEAALSDSQPAVNLNEDDRHNFALAKDGAKVIAANKEAKKANALLDNDGDTYLKNECKADKWVILELSQVAKIDTLLMSQNELYSSRVKEFEAKGRQTHPRLEGTDYAKALNSSNWQLMGAFNASNVKGSQVFKFDEPTWVKYIQLKFLSHHGAEAVCALNDICVYGKSAAEDLEDRLNIEAQEDKKTTAKPSDEIVTAQPADIPSTINDASEPASDKEIDGHLQEKFPTDEVEQRQSVASHEPQNLHPQDVPALTPPTQADVADRLELANIEQSTKPEEAKQDRENSKSQPEFQEPGVNESTKQDVVLSQNEDAEQKVTIDSRTSAANEPDKEELPANSAGSSASRHGGNMYDIIIQELKAAKLAQKENGRLLNQLRQNITAVLGGFALEMDALSMRLNKFDPQHLALPPVEEELQQCESEVGSKANKSNTRGTEQALADSMQCRVSPPQFQILRAPTELEILQEEVGQIRNLIGEMQSRASRRLREAKCICVILWAMWCGVSFFRYPTRIQNGMTFLVLAASTALLGYIVLLDSQP